MSTQMLTSPLPLIRADGLRQLRSATGDRTHQESLESEVEPAGQFVFDSGDPLSIHQQVFNPDLHAIGHVNHFHAQAKVIGKGA